MPVETKQATLTGYGRDDKACCCAVAIHLGSRLLEYRNYRPSKFTSMEAATDAMMDYVASRGVKSFVHVDNLLSPELIDRTVLLACGDELIECDPSQR